MFCKFCNHEVDPVMHIIKCPHCGAEDHEVEDHQYECAGCGRKFSQAIPTIPAREGEEELNIERDIPTSEEQDDIGKKVRNKK